MVFDSSVRKSYETTMMRVRRTAGSYVRGLPWVLACRAGCDVAKRHELDPSVRLCRDFHVHHGLLSYSIYLSVSAVTPAVTVRSYHQEYSYIYQSLPKITPPFVRGFCILRGMYISVSLIHTSRSIFLLFIICNR